MSSPIISVPIKYFFILIVSVIIVYGQCVHFAFVNYDDDELIYHNETFLSEWHNIGTGFTSHAFIGAGGASIYYRPVLLASFITDYHIWKLDPFGYHLTNLILHAIATLIVFLLLRMLFLNGLIALFGSFIFSFHPIQTESVGWIAGRNDILLGLFIVSMMFFYIKARRGIGPSKWNYIFSLLCFTFAIFTKESAAFYILLFVCYDILLHSTPDPKSNFFSVSAIQRYSPFIGLLIMYLIIRWNIFGALIGAERMYGANKPFSDRFINIPGIVIEHLRLIIAPFNLSVAHPLTDIVWLLQPLYLVAVFALCLSVYLTWKLYKKNRTVCFGLLWLAIGLLPTLNVVPMPKPILEHRLYVPMVGASIAVSYGVFRLNLRNLQHKHKLLFLFVISLVCALTTYVRVPVWQNGVTLFSDAVRKAPADLHSNYSLALALYDAEKYPETISAIQNYLTLAPDDLRAYRIMRDSYYAIGQKSSVASISRKMIDLDPHTARRYIEAGVIYEELNLSDSALMFYSHALPLDSSNAEIYFRMGVNEEKLSHPDLAVQNYRRAIELQPGYAEAYLQLSSLYVRNNEPIVAIKLLERGLQTVSPPNKYLTILFNLYKISGFGEKAKRLKQQYQF
jgi:protein O-mannosyl-transferase